ncbi:peptidase inhibitor family I36 protein [Amycolatopsis sp. SID8362]|uniref:peptidase inhibitor family I36 protein n=1 Tax=Amycolatopsis sp. SID8362 TaxID=2690346 RepID=UPI001368138F|nr:peptidase inhibitor family I36 protein [Amycolatopsis sp. SID8362]NBH05117.1 hypothetical protein [Amycolatopsis sp. SID8362]NED41817.1 peptidase inhibitor family I36 protein [Amycolatopsis sp. SID8362]
MRHLSQRLAAVTLLAAATTAVSAAPGYAATGYDRCPSGYFCLFADANGGGTIAYFHFGSPDLRQQHIDNAATSVWNRSSDAFALCDSYNYAGQITDVFPGARSNLDASENNRASSVNKGAHSC